MASPPIDAARAELYACATDLEAIRPFLEAEEPGVEIVQALWDKLWIRFLAACRRLDKALDPRKPPADAE